MNLYGGSYNQLKVMLPRIGIQTRFVPNEDAEGLVAAIDDNTKAVFVESISNPRYTVPDYEAIAKAVHEKGVPFIVGLLHLPFWGEAKKRKKEI